MEPDSPQVQPETEEKNSIAILSYLGILFIVPLLVDKDNPFVKFHVKQGIVLCIAEFATQIVWIVPFLGWLIGVAAIVLWFVLAIKGILNVLAGKQTPLPIIGQFAEKINL